MKKFEFNTILALFCICFFVLVATVVASSDDDDDVPVYGAYGNKSVGFIRNKIFMVFGSIGRELEVREPSMCEGAAWWVVDWDKPSNRVNLRMRAFGLPYRPKICYEYNPSTAYNRYPDCVENGRWQMWIVPRFFDYPVTYFYTKQGILIGNEFDLGGQTKPPKNAINITSYAAILIGTDLFEGDPTTLVADHTYHFEYHRVLDGEGNAGTIAGIVLANLTDPQSIFVHYTNFDNLIKPLPTFSWGDMLDFINQNKSFTISSTYQPYPKPAYLTSRDNTMVGWSSQWGVNAHQSVAQTLNAHNKTCGNGQFPLPGRFS